METSAWGNFYLIMSASAATLVGLLFVVLTLASDRMPASGAKQIRLYLTPSVLQLALVLVLAAALMFPTQTRLSAAISCGSVGALGIIYAASVVLEGLRGNALRERSDLLQYALLPALGYAALVIGGVAIDKPSDTHGPTIVAAGALELLALAIRNSWSVAVSVVSLRGEKPHDRGPT
ncbi:MAG TPA: hypothetical protein VH143_34040 [Kofleriaceae bacterium]|jgi:hypothetical protein|nr:hypothetical protein [Kofleriaceae bacterium]